MLVRSVFLATVLLSLAQAVANLVKIGGSEESSGQVLLRALNNVDVSQPSSVSSRPSSSTSRSSSSTSRSDSEQLGWKFKVMNLLMNPRNLFATSRPKQLTDQRRLEITTQWAINQHKLRKFYRRSNELSALETQTTESLTKQLKRWRTQFVPYFSEVEDNYLALEIVKQLKNDLTIFKQLKMFELGAVELQSSNAKLLSLVLSSKNHHPSRHLIESTFNKLSAGPIDSIIKKTWENFGDMSVKELKENYFNRFSYDFLITDTPGKYLWDYTLRSFDFMFHYNFISGDAIKEFFQGERTSRYLGSYTSSVVRNQMQEFQLSGSYCLTDHWYWQLLHESFKALGKRSETTINVVCMQIRHIFRPEVDNIEGRGLQENWISFYNKFEARYLVHWGITTNSIEHDIQKMIALVATTDNRFLDPQQEQIRIYMEYIIDLLGLIEDVLFPNLHLVEQELSNHPDYHEFDNRFKLIKLSANLNYLHRNANEFYEHINNNDPSGWFTSSINKTFFDHNLNKYIDLFKQYDTEAARVNQKNNHQIESEFYISTRSVINHLQTLLDDLVQKSNSFLVPVENVV